MIDYRSLVGKMAWPAHESMPLMSYDVSDFQQRTKDATVTVLKRANNVLLKEKEWVKRGTKFYFPFDVGNPTCDHTENGNGLAAITASSLASQPDLGSQQGYALSDRRHHCV